MGGVDNTVICPACGEPVEAANQGIAVNSGEIIHLDCLDDGE